MAKSADFKKLKEGTPFMFKGKEYVFLWWSKETGMPLTTNEERANFDMSSGHIYPNGKIKSRGKVLGSISDIILFERRKK